MEHQTELEERDAVDDEMRILKKAVEKSEGGRLFDSEIFLYIVRESKLFFN